MTSLFRAEMIEHRARRLHGDVVLGQSLSSRALTGLIVACVALAGYWLTAGSYARIETARGVLVATGGTAKILAQRAGTVSEVLVGEGDLVVAGQRLATVGSEQPDAGGNSFAAQSLMALKGQQALARERIALARQRGDNQLRRLQIELTALRETLAGLQSQLGLQRQLVESVKTSFEPFAALDRAGTISHAEFEDRRQRFIAVSQDEQRLVQQIAATSNDILRVQADVDRVPLETAREIAELDAAILGLDQQITRLRSEQGYALVAPVSGRVTALQVAKGQVVGGAVPLMTIVSDTALLRADIFVPSRAIGFVMPGQEVRLLYDAFPYQRFGSFPGQILSVSRVVLGPNEVNAPLQINEPVYRVSVVLDAQVLRAFDETIPLQPGMMLTANIVQDRRSFLDWLLTPFNAVRKRSA